MEKIKIIPNWVKAHKWEFFLLLTILVVGAFLRLYRISEYMIYLGDEGRDAILVRRFLAEGDIMLIGPGTSVGNMYLGPLYYYLIAPALFLANYSPVGPSVLVALIGVATIFLVYFVARKWFSPRAGLVAASLYAVSPTVIIYSLSSWNPNVMPFFSLLTLYSLWQVWQEEKYQWLIVAGVSLAFVLQSHYLGVLLVPVFGVFWLLSLRGSKMRSFLWYSFFGFVIFILLMSPLFFFDLRHNWMNFQALRAFLTGGESFSFNLFGFLQNLWLTFRLMIVRLLAGRNEIVGTFLAVFFIIVLIYRFLEKSLGHSHCRFLLVWLGFGLLGLSFYRYQIYDHYFGFLFPAPFLFFAGLLEYLSGKTKKSWGKGVWYLLLTILILVNLRGSHLWYGPNRQLQRSMEIAGAIGEKAAGEKFNLAVISENNRREAYLYFLILWERGVVDKEPMPTVYSVTDQLFVVCEKPERECDPTHDSSAWVTEFGWSEIESQWEVAGVNLYKLVHSK